MKIHSSYPFLSTGVCVHCTRLFGFRVHWNRNEQHRQFLNEFHVRNPDVARMQRLRNIYVSSICTIHSQWCVCWICLYTTVVVSAPSPTFTLPRTPSTSSKIYQSGNNSGKSIAIDLNKFFVACKTDGENTRIGMRQVKKRQIHTHTLTLTYTKELQTNEENWRKIPSDKRKQNGNLL